jgi:hypothetical protein
MIAGGAAHAAAGVIALISTSAPTRLREAVDQALAVLLLIFFAKVMRLPAMVAGANAVLLIAGFAASGSRRSTAPGAKRTAAGVVGIWLTWPPGYTGSCAVWQTGDVMAVRQHHAC